MRRIFHLFWLLATAACTGGMSERSTALLQGRLDLPPDLASLQVALEDGHVEVQPATERAIVFRGGVRRAADTREELAVIEAAGAEVRLLPVAGKPGAYVLRGPDRPADSRGVLAIEVKLEVPPDIPLQVVMKGSGGLVADDRRAATELATGRGDVRLTRCAGAGKVQTGHGMVIVYDHRGDLDVEVGVGGVQVFVREPGQRLRVIDNLGDVQCYVPIDAGFRVDARVETGKIANGFGFEVQRPAAYSATMAGSRGDGRTEIVLRAGTGHLSLSHKTFD